MDSYYIIFDDNQYIYIDRNANINAVWNGQSEMQKRKIKEKPN